MGWRWCAGHNNPDSADEIPRSFVVLVYSAAPCKDSPWREADDERVGTMSPQLRAAALRAVWSALLAFLGTYAATILTVEDDCSAKAPAATANCEAGTDSKQEKAVWPSIAAAVAVLAGRGAVEGAYDAKRQRDGNQKPADVTAGPVDN